MGRNVSTDLATVLAGPRMIDYTLDLVFPDASEKRYATSPLTLGGHDYSNDLDNVREIRQTIDAAPDRVGIELQNMDRVLSVDLATNWQKWRTCEATLKRYYRGGPGFAVSDWVEMFRGAVQQPNADDKQVTFDILHDTLSAGNLVSKGTLNPLCQNVFKAPTTCGYAGSETSCDHHLKSKYGCDGLGNSHRFRGMEHRYNPDASAPGSGGNTGGGGSYCPRLDQWVLIRRDGEKMVQMVGFLAESDELWNPIVGRFIPIRSLTLIPSQPIWEVLVSNGALGYGTFNHPVIRYTDDLVGTPAHKLATQDDVLTVIRGELSAAKVLLSCPAEETADVLLIELYGEAAEKIYCWGDNAEKLIVCHNAKPTPID